MTALRTPLRRALVSALVVALAATGAVAATSAANAAPGKPILSLGSLIGTTTGSTSANVFVEDGLDQTVSVWYLEPGVTDPAERQLFCSFFVAAAGPAGGTCFGSVPAGQLGEYRMFATADDGTGESVPSDLGWYRYGESASVVPLVVDAPLNGGGQLVLESPSVDVSGTAPAMSRVEVRATSVSPVVSAVICTVDPVPASGEYSCTGSLPSPTYGQWTIDVTARDVAFVSTPAPAGGPYAIVTAPPVPTVGGSATGSSLTVLVDGLPSSNVGAELILNGFGTPTSAGFCPAGWSGSPLTPPALGPSVVCGFLSVPPGVHIVSSAHFLNATATLSREDAVYVPATPSLSVEAVPGGAVFRGAVTGFDAVTNAGAQVDALQIEVRDGANQVVCTTNVNLVTGQWQCGAEVESGADVFTASASAVGFGDAPDAFPGVDGYIGGRSAPSSGVAVTVTGSVTPAAPTVSYGLGAASIDVTAAGLPNSALTVELYQVDDVPGEGYVYGFPVAACGLVSESEGEGEGGGGFIDGIPPSAPSTVSDCTFSGLAPGIWNVYTSQQYYFASGENRDDYVLIPPAPSLTAAVTSTGQIIASGTGVPGNRVIVRELGGASVCTAIVSSGGAWTCTIAGVTGEVVLRAQQQSQGFEASPPVSFGPTASFDGFSAFAPVVAVTVPGAVPSAEPQPLAWVLEGYDGGPLVPGQVLDLSARGLPPQTEVVVEIRSTPQLLGTTVADALGAFALSVTVPADLEPGDHTLVATATPPGGVPSAIAIPVTVVPAEPIDDAAAPVAEQPEAGPRDGNAMPALDRSDLAAPSAITDSIPTLQRVFNDPWVALASGGLALAILLLVAFPAELLNSTLSSNTSRLGRWFVAIERKTEQVTEWFTRVSRTRALAAAVLVALTAVIFGFVDPQYGFDPVSLRMTVSLAIGLFLITYVSAWISGSIARRAWGVTTQISLQPVALLFAVVGVVVARLLEFSPGFLIGLVIGLDLLSRVDAAVRARVVVLSTAVVASIAVVAWFAFSALVAASSGTPGWVELLISDALVATTAEGLTAALASLLPLGFLAGHEVFRHSKPLWAGTFIAVGALFALIVLPTAAGETTDVADVGFWMLVMVIFAVVTLSLWAVLQFTGRRGGDDEGSGSTVEQPVAGAAR